MWPGPAADLGATVQCPSSGGTEYCEGAIPNERQLCEDDRRTTAHGVSEPMTSAQFDANRGGDDAAPDGGMPRLNGVTPAQVARFILGLGGSLVSLDARKEGEADILVYTFAVASKEQSFVAPVRDRAVESIASVFPEAAAREADLRDRHGILFEEPPVP